MNNCPDCDRAGLCQDCCCVHPAHRVLMPCPLCAHEAKPERK